MGEDFYAAGHLSRSVLEAVGIPREADVYLCGPAAFMADMRAALAGFGAPPERIHMEIFNGSEAKSPGVVGAVKRTSHPPVSDSNTGSLVSFARSGIAAHWNPSAYQNILELAEACDVPVRWACRSGVCHSCESGLVSGAVAYAPDPSTDLLKAIFWFAAMSSSICEASPRRNLRCFSVHSVPKVDEQEGERAAIECAAAGSFSSSVSHQPEPSD